MYIYLVSMRKALLTYENQKGLYQSKVTSSLASTQRQGHQAHNCKMDYRQPLPWLYATQETLCFLQPQELYQLYGMYKSNVFFFFFFFLRVISGRKWINFSCC